MGRKRKQDKEIPTIGIGDIVYLRTDCDKRPRLIVSYEVLPYEGCRFKLKSGDKISKHYDFEIELAPDSRIEVKGFSLRKDESHTNKQKGQAGEA